MKNFTKTFRFAAAGALSLAVGATLVAQTQQPGGAPGAAPGGAPGAAQAAPEPQVDPGKVVITVGGSKMTAGEFNDFLSALPPEVQAMAKGPAKRRIAEDLVKLKLLASEAQKQQLDQTPKFKQQMELMRDNALAGALFSKLQTSLVSDADVQKYYDENKASFERVTAAHILVSPGGQSGLTEEQAKAKADDLKKKLDGGADFAAVAKENSADPGSKDEGGAMPPFTRGEMVPEFEEAAFKLEPNKVSDPVKTKFGYHLIKVTKKEASPLEEVKEEILETLRPKKLESVVEDLRKQANPQLDDTFFGPPLPATPAPGDAPVAPPTK